MNPNQGVTQPIQNHDNHTTQYSEKPLDGNPEKQPLALCEQSNSTSEHQIGANMVREIASDTELAEIVTAWPQLPEPTRSAIVAIVRGEG